MLLAGRLYFNKAVACFGDDLVQQAKALEAFAGKYDDILTDDDDFIFQNFV